MQSEEAWTSEGVKAVPPYNFVVAAYRGTGMEPNDSALRTLERFDQAVREPPSPEGWPDEDGAWLQPDGLVERVDWAWDFATRIPAGPSAPEFAETVLASALDGHTREMIERAESREQGLALFLMAPQVQRR